MRCAQKTEVVYYPLTGLSVELTRERSCTPVLSAKQSLSADANRNNNHILLNCVT